MAIPKVAIVGRPNVGKSSIFNWLVGRRVAIVDPTAGVTRDRVTHVLEENGRYFELTDTGGMGIEDSDGLTKDVERQIQHALDEACLILFVVDAKDGLVALDHLVIDRLRGTGKPIVMVANKSDNARLRSLAESEFHRFGLPLIFTSATVGLSKSELLDAIVSHLPPSDDEPPPDAALKLAIVGKTNVGKSTFINVLANSDRVITSETPGTTRDSIDVHFERNGKRFIAVDTAGVRRTRGGTDNIAFYSQVRAEQAIHRADVILLFLDAPTSIGAIEKHLARHVVERYKPCIFVINKWDLMRPRPTGDFNEYLTRSLPDLAYAPRAFVTAKTGRNALKLIDLAQHLYKQALTRVSTASLNKVVQLAVSRSNPPSRQNRVPKIFFASQVAVAPPTIVLSCNHPSLFTRTYQRYLLNFFRERLPFDEVPIKLIFKRRDSQGPEEEGKEEKEKARG